MIDLETIAPIETSWNFYGESWKFYDEACGIREATAKAVARRCWEICMARYMGDNNREDAEARRCAQAIAAEFGLFSSKPNAL